MQQAEEAGPILPPNRDKMRFCDVSFVWVSQLFHDGGHLDIDGLQKFVARVDAPVQPLKHECEIFLGGRFDRVLGQGMLHFQLEVVLC